MNNCLTCYKPTKYTYCSLSCSNIGRLPKNKERYYQSPKRCLHCQAAIQYEARFDNTFCCHSCAATYTNVRKARYAKPKPEKLGIEKLRRERFLLGQVNKRSTIRRHLISIHGNHCFVCRMEASWQNQPLVLVVDHTDGNAANNMPDNLRLLCPNCNSQTTTFCGRNYRKGRQSRGLPKH